MGWFYFTNISPYEEPINSFNEAFDIFLAQCLIHEERLKKEFTGSENKCFRFLIKTDGENDKIYCRDGKYLLKSKFLMNKTFKKKLIEYYRPKNIYVTGPKEIISRDKKSFNKWIIELTQKI